MNGQPLKNLQTHFSFRERFSGAARLGKPLIAVPFDLFRCLRGHEARYLGLSFPLRWRILKFDPVQIFMRSSTMLRCIPMRLALPVLLSATLLPPLPLPNRRIRSPLRKLPAAPARRRRTLKSPAKVITDDTLEVKKGDVQSATAEQLRIPGTPATPAQPPQTRRPLQPRAKRKASDMNSVPRTSPR